MSRAAVVILACLLARQTPSSTANHARAQHCDPLGLHGARGRGDGARHSSTGTLCEATSSGWRRAGAAGGGACRRGRLTLRGGVEASGGGGGEEGAFVEEIGDNSTLREELSTQREIRAILAPKRFCWDYRVMDPWVRRFQDELEEYALEPVDGAQIHLTSNAGAPARMDGQWEIPPRARGSFRTVEFCYETKMLDARSVMIIHGGPWRFDQSQIRAAGCQVMRLEYRGDVCLDDCFVGGYGFDRKSDFERHDDLRASNGVVVLDFARLDARASRLELTGFLGGAAIKVRGDAAATVRGCVIRRNVVGLRLDNNGVVLMEGSLVSENLGATFWAELRNNVTVTLRNNTCVGPVMWECEIFPKVLRDEGNTYSKDSKPLEERFWDDIVDIPIYEKDHDETGEPFWCDQMEKAGIKVDKGPNQVFCLECGADNDLDESSECNQCGGQDMSVKYVGAGAGSAEPFFPTAGGEGPGDKEAFMEELRSLNKEQGGGAQRTAASAEPDQEAASEEEEEEGAGDISGGDLLPSDFSEGDMGEKSAEQESAAGLMQVLRQRVVERFDTKEDLKRRYRETRDTNTRSELVGAQEEYAAVREQLSSLIQPRSPARSPHQARSPASARGSERW